MVAKHFKCLQTPNFYALSSKLTCACCNNSIIGHTGTGRNKLKYHYYKCVGNEAKHICHLPAIMQDELEEKVQRTVIKAITSYDITKLAEEIIKEYGDDKYNNRIEEIDNEIKDIDTQISNLTNLLARNRSVDIILDKIDALSSRKAILDDELYTINRSKTKIDRDCLIERLNNIKEFKFVNKQALEAFAEAFVERIIVYKNKK